MVRTIINFSFYDKILREKSTYLNKFFSKIRVEPSIEDWITDTGAHGQCMTKAKSKEIIFGICNGDYAKISDSEK